MRRMIATDLTQSDSSARIIDVDSGKTPLAHQLE
jgi:hypothetical protein